MANGDNPAGVLGTIFGDGRGRDALSGAILLSLAYGVSWWQSREVLGDIREEMRREVAIQSTYNTERINHLVGEIGRLRVDMGALEQELRDEIRSFYSRTPSRDQMNDVRDRVQSIERRVYQGN